MDRALLFLLLLLPGLAQAVICKTVGADGVVSFSDVPAADCPQGSRIPDYRQAAPQAERAGAVDTGVSARQVKFAGYDSIEIVTPEDGGTVRSNEGRVPVVVRLEPELQQSHFITAYLDGRAYKGRYGRSEITLTGVDRGTHNMYVTVRDSKGKTLIKSGEISFTLHKVNQDLVVNPITGDDYVRRPDYDNGNNRDTVPVRGSYTGRSVGGIFLRFPVRQTVTNAVPVGPEQTIKYWIITADNRREQVTETFNWEIEVPREWLETEASFEAVAIISPQNEVKTTSTHSVDPTLWRPLPPDYTTTPGQTNPAYPGIIATPGETNPAFPGVPTTPGATNPAFPGVPTTPGQTNPAYPGISPTPGQTNPAFTR